MFFGAIDHMHRFKLQTKEILRKTERYTRTDMVYLAKNGFWSLCNQAIGSGSSFVVVLLLANILSKGSFGQYRFILSLISVLGLFTLPGIGTTLLRSVARGNAVLLSSIARTKLTWSFLCTLLSFAASVYYFHVGDSTLGYSLVLTGLFLPFTETYYIYVAYYKGRQDFKTAALYDSSSRIFQALVLVVVAFLTRNVVALIAAFLVGQLIARFFFYTKTVAYAKAQPVMGAESMDAKDDTVAYGKSLSAVSILNTLTNNMDVLILGHFLGPYVLAIYYVALAIPKNIVLIFSVIARVALPKFSQKKWDLHERTSVFRKLGLMFAALFLPAALYVLCAPFVLHIFFKGYGASIPAALILSILILVSPMNALVGQVLQARKLVAKIVVLEVLSFLSFFVCFLLSYQAWGAFGTAFALVISETAVLVAGIVFIGSGEKEYVG